MKKKVLPRFELGSQDSESWVLTVTPQNRYDQRLYTTQHNTKYLFRPGICQVSAQTHKSTLEPDAVYNWRAVAAHRYAA